MKPATKPQKNRQLIQARKERGWTQREMAKVIGISSNSYLSRLEAGLIRPRIDTARRIALALGKPVGDIFLR